MNKKLAQTISHREHLIAQIAAQRTDLTQNMHALRPPLALADRGITVFRYVKRHPALLVGASLLFVVIRPKRSGKWLKLGLMVWQLRRGLLRH